MIVKCLASNLLGIHNQQFRGDISVQLKHDIIEKTSKNHYLNREKS